MKESTIFKKVMLALHQIPGVKCFWNNVGMAYIGKTTRLKNGQHYIARQGDIVVHSARPFHAGLVKGSGDGIGWRTITITPDMVGQQVAQFLSVETKTKSGRVRDDQKNWQDVVNNSGGLAVIVRSEVDAVELVGGGRSE
jgi:hypothetical protein